MAPMRSASLGSMDQLAMGIDIREDESILGVNQATLCSTVKANWHFGCKCWKMRYMQILLPTSLLHAQIQQNRILLSYPEWSSEQDHFFEILTARSSSRSISKSTDSRT
ncbi:unnamed protein product [Sympodiomycopsis kandeliae]